METLIYISSVSNLRRTRVGGLLSKRSVTRPAEFKIRNYAILELCQFETISGIRIIRFTVNTFYVLLFWISSVFFGYSSHNEVCQAYWKILINSKLQNTTIEHSRQSFTVINQFLFKSKSTLSNLSSFWSNLKHFTPFF